MIRFLAPLRFVLTLFTFFLSLMFIEPLSSIKEELTSLVSSAGIVSSTIYCSNLVGFLSLEFLRMLGGMNDATEDGMSKR